MSRRKSSAFLLIVIVVCGLAIEPVGPAYAQSAWMAQNAKVEPRGADFDALKELTATFPTTVTVKEKGHFTGVLPRQYL